MPETSLLEAVGGEEWLATNAPTIEAQLEGTPGGYFIPTVAMQACPTAPTGHVPVDCVPPPPGFFDKLMMWANANKNVVYISSAALIGLMLVGGRRKR